ncbi:uncharacterized protein LOC132560716 [Ylistrum balloti]|uniref:uncharacterized protein LOC132560716 n=1 Tax=Ylistrum balloti TaxID=509963 RepID=UPI002905B5B3|nr:uncharacterized protein LOC132560716 [Ylistrum balloti]XP_060081376.1 uncharacterized protein LOC132560716 [Ylistrum balloti]
MALAAYKEENLCCPICTEDLREPKSLPCCHGFCKECLHFYIMSKPPVHVKRLVGFNCPICRAFTAALNQKSPRHQWASDFLTDFRFVSMLESLPDVTESSVSSSASCTCLQAPLDVYCRTHLHDICKTCASNSHRKCSTISKDMAKMEFDRDIKQLQGLIKTLEKEQNDLGRSENSTDTTHFRHSFVGNRQINHSKIKNNIETTVDGIMKSHHLNMSKRKEECQMIIEDAHYQLKQAMSLGSQSTCQLCTSSDVLKVTLENLADRRRHLTRLPNSLADIKTRTSAYISCAISPLKPKDSSIEFERKGSNFPSVFALRLHESFNAKLPSDLRNCLITGAAILTDGRVVLADTNNSNIKLFSSNFAFLNCISLLAPPFDIAETECNNIAVTFGKRNVIHFYEVNDKLPYEHESISTDQPCYGMSSGSDLLYVYCGNSWLNPSCIRIYDYSRTLVTKVFMEMFSAGEYLGYCPVSEYMYATSQNLLSPQQLLCYPGDGNCKKILGFSDRNNKHIMLGQIRGMVGVKCGLIMAVRSMPKTFGLVLSRSTIIFGDNRSITNDNMYTKVLMGKDEAQFARVVASNKQRTMLLVGQESPFIIEKRNNQVKMFRVVRN